MASITLMALLDARPSGPFWGRRWLEDVLGQQLPGFAPQSGHSNAQRLCGWSVGTVVGNETLVQSRPVILTQEINPLDDLLRTPAGCTIAAFASASASSAFHDAAEAVRPARFRRWVGIRAPCALDPRARDELWHRLPAFLARGVRQTDTDTLFLGFLARLHDLGGLGKRFAQPALVRTALRQLDEDLSDAHPTLMVTDGRTLGILHRGGCLLAFEPPSDVQPRRRAPSDDALANLLLWRECPPAAPVGGAERIVEGILSAPATEPRRLTRDS